MAGGKMSESFRIEMDPSAGALVEGFENWVDLVDDWRPTWRYAVPTIRKHHGRTFDSEGAATGARARWAPLSPRTLATKPPGLPILVRTGALRRALVEGGPGSTTKADRKSLEMGLTGRNRRIATYHMTGTRRMPARPPIAFDRDPRPSGTLAYVITQMVQATAVMPRRAALQGRKVTNADRVKLAGTLSRLSQRQTR